MTTAFVWNIVSDSDVLWPLMFIFLLYAFEHICFERQVLSWLSTGALVGALETLPSRSLSRDAYIQRGRLPDWCCLDQDTWIDEHSQSRRWSFKLSQQNGIRCCAILPSKVHLVMLTVKAHSMFLEYCFLCCVST